MRVLFGFQDVLEVLKTQNCIEGGVQGGNGKRLQSAIFNSSVGESIHL